VIIVSNICTDKQTAFLKNDFFSYQVKYLMIVTGPTSETLPLKKPKFPE